MDDDERTFYWSAEDWGEGGNEDLWVTNNNLNDDHAVTVYLSDIDFDQQLARLVTLLNRVAPDGVLPDDEASS